MNARQLARESERKMPLRNDKEAAEQRVSIIQAAIEKALKESDRDWMLALQKRRRKGLR